MFIKWVQHQVKDSQKNNKKTLSQLQYEITAIKYFKVKNPEIFIKMFLRHMSF
jgi:hypothetical protein